jgi:hypothetical protein
MKNIFFTVVALLGLFVLLPVLILWTRDKIQFLRRRETPTQRDVRQKARRARLLHPNVDETEAFCGGRVPQKLLDMYEAPDLLLGRDFQVCAPGKDPRKDSWWIGDFVPLHKQDQEVTTDLTEFGKGCCFAGDGMGNFYWVPVDAKQCNDAPVFFACHDPWGNEKVSETLTEFLSWPRLQKKDS